MNNSKPKNVNVRKADAIVELPLQTMDFSNYRLKNTVKTKVYVIANNIFEH